PIERPWGGPQQKANGRHACARDQFLGWEVVQSLVPCNGHTRLEGKQRNNQQTKARTMHSDLTRKLTRMLQSSPVIPVITLERLADAVPLAEALVAGGLTTLEITLRSKVGLEAIRRVAAEVPKASVGAGTVLCMRQFEQAENAGARFIVSPGTTLELLEAARHSPVPFL